MLCACLAKKQTNIAMMECNSNSHFLVCTHASFSSKYGKCAFGCASLKDTIVYAGSFRARLCILSKEAEMRYNVPHRK